MDDRVVESTGTPPQYAMVESWLAAGNRLERNSAALVAFDTDLCLVEPCSSALRAPARFREFLLVEGESAAAATGRDDDDLMARRPCRTERMLQVIVDIAFPEPKISRE